MELRGAFQEISPRLLPDSGPVFGSLFATETKQIKQTLSKQRSENQGARATNDNFVHNEAGCPSAVARLGEAFWIATKLPFNVHLINIHGYERLFSCH